ncbi:MAG: YkgJ family cysteine cluster protein [Eubacteriales bacterium]|jgi:Fe-S-cluster containining protein
MRQDKTPIQRLYDRIPKTRCKSGCFRCCINYVQMAKEERERMGGYEWNGRCPHLTSDGKCGVYDARPLVCRIYGASELLLCLDCECAEPLGEDETKSLLREYLREAEKLI